MKALFKWMRPAAGLLALCLMLTLAQAACELALPGVLAGLVTRGVQQGGLEAGAPEAVSLQGMTLLQTFLSEEDRETLGDQYFIIRPGSTEADRIAQDYPLVREQTVCLRREGLTGEEEDALDRLYAKAADGLSRYLERAEETGELEETAQRFAEEQRREPGEFRSNIRDFQREKEEKKTESSLPEGVVGKIPEGALFTIPGREESSSQPGPSAEPGVSEEPLPENGSAAERGGFSGEATMGTQASVFGAGEPTEAPAESAAPEAGEKRSALPAALDSAGVAAMDADQLYTLLPLLAQTAHSSVGEVLAQAEAAAESDPDRGARLGIPLKALFYRELGVKVDGLRARVLGEELWKLAGLTLLGLVLAGAAWLLTARTANALGRSLRRELVARGQSATGDVRPAQRLIARGLRGLCYAPVLLLGSLWLGAQIQITAGGRLALILAAAMAVILAAAAVFRLPVLKAPAKLAAGLRRKLGPVEGLGAALLVPAGLLGMNLVCGIFALADDPGIRNAVLPVGARMAALEYAGMALLAGILLAWALWELPGERAAARRVLGEKKEGWS